MSFARGTWRFLVGVKDLLVLLLLLLFFGLLWAGLNQTSTVKVPASGALVLNLSGAVVDQGSEQDPTQILLGRQGIGETQLRDVVRAIDLAAADKRITMLVLDLDSFLGTSQAHLQTITEAMARFKKAGKPIKAWGTAYLDDGWYLAAHADEAWMSPLGGVLLSGPGGSGLYFANALEKLGIDMEVFRVGTFKSAVEPFTRNDASPEARAADQALVDALWSSYKAGIAAARPKVALDRWFTALPQRIAEANGSMAEAAAAAGLVDRIATRPDFDAALVKQLGASDKNSTYPFKSVTFIDWLKANRSLVPERGPAVGIVYISGDIIDGEAPRGTAGAASIVDALQKARAENAELKALVLRIDSPGGSVTASEDIRQAILAAKADGLPVVASFGSIAASGGYWVASAADAIYAQPGSITGSIGIFALLPTFPRALNRLGIGIDGVKSTPFSGEPNVLGGLGSESRQLLQLSLEDNYRRFLRIVSESRNLPLERVDEIGQGRIWSAPAALELKLIDKMGGLDDAVAEAARRAGLERGKVRTIAIERKPTTFASLLAELSGSTEVRAADPWALANIRARLRLSAMLADLEAMAGGATLQAACLECAGMAGPRPARAAGIERRLATLLQSSAR